MKSSDKELYLTKEVDNVSKEEVIRLTSLSSKAG